MFGKTPGTPRSPCPKLLAAVLLASIVAPADFGAPPDEEELFETRVRPVLAKRCFPCHTDSQLGGLRVDSRDDLLKGGKSGPAIVPGKPEESLLIRAVSHTDERLKMPLGASKLEDDEISALTSWVKAGAYWPHHKSAPAPIRSDSYVITPEHRAFWSFLPLAKPGLPQVRNRAWTKGSLDYFILSRLEAHGLKPVGMADKRALIRRATFDLIGLPPSPEEVTAFLKDTSADAFSSVVERLLASPHYGERWGRYWLDVARYSEDDVRGVKQEQYPNGFRYRDWVVNAFNQDMPYDLFIRAQIAGDLLEHERGGIHPPGGLIAGTGFFGVGPWYYDTAQPPMARANERNDRVDVVTRGLLGLTAACARCHNHKYDPISMKDYYALAGVFAGTEYAEYPLAPEKVVNDFKRHQLEEQEAAAALKDFISRQKTELGEILAYQTSQYVLAAWEVLRGPKLAAGRCAEKRGLDRETLERWIAYLVRPEHDHPYLNAWRELLARTGSMEEAKNVADGFQRVLLTTLNEKKAIDEENQPSLREAELAREKRHKDVLLPNQFVTYDDYVPNGRLTLKSLDRDKLVLWRDILADKGVLIYVDQNLDRFLSAEWKRHLYTLRTKLEDLKKTEPPPYPYLHGIADVSRPGSLKLHIRGNPENLGEEVPRRYLAILSRGEPVPFRIGSGRLELAEAIPSHPLFARVIANRIWQHHFTRGIVASPDNFGLLGERPTHPELLEYLARRLVENNWSIKALHREIMLSATYQLSSDYSDHESAIDPDNQFYWRMNHRRLDAEAIRDALLFVSGNLDPTLGGPSAELTPANTRRSIYCKVSRFKLNDMLATFDFPEPTTTSALRNVTNVPLQGLFFLNSELVQHQSDLLANRLLAVASASDATRLRKAYDLLYGRQVTDSEMHIGMEFLATAQEKSANRLAAWRQLAHALLSTNEFIYLD